MEMMPYHPARATGHRARPGGRRCPPSGSASAADWRDGLPVLQALGLTLRELHAADAPSLCAQLTTEQVTRFISPPPTQRGGLRALHRVDAPGARGGTLCVLCGGARRRDGRGGHLPGAPARRAATAWPSGASFSGAAYWGTGLFLAGAQRVVDFAFGAMGLRRLEARAAVTNGRGNGALQKLGAVPEARLRQSFERHGERHDQLLWGLLRDDWSCAPDGPHVGPLRSIASGAQAGAQRPTDTGCEIERGLQSCVRRAPRLLTQPLSTVLSRAGLLAVAYAAAGYLGLLVPAFGTSITLVWLPTGIAVAALLRWGSRLWIGVWLGAVAVNLLNGSSIPVALGMGVGNTLGPLLAAQVVHRLGSESRLRALARHSGPGRRRRRRHAALRIRRRADRDTGRPAARAVVHGVAAVVGRRRHGGHPGRAAGAGLHSTRAAARFSRDGRSS